MALPQDGQNANGLTQHKPFLDDAVKSRGLKIASVAPIHILPM